MPGWNIASISETIQIVISDKGNEERQVWLCTWEWHYFIKLCDDVLLLMDALEWFAIYAWMYIIMNKVGYALTPFSLMSNSVEIT